MALALDELLDALGLDAIGVLNPGVDLHAEVRTTVVADVDALGTLPDGAFALVPGPRPQPDELRAALQAADAAGVVAVALRARGDDAQPDAALGRSVAVVGIPPGILWGDLYEAITTLVASAGGIAPHRPRDRPMADLFAFADAVAAATGGAVCIEDPQTEMLAYSNLPDQTVDEVREMVILQRRVPATAALRAEYLELSRATGVTRFAARREGELPRLATAVRAGDQIAGFMFVIDSGSLAEDAAVQLAAATRMAAVHLVRARATGDIGRRTHDEALRRLLNDTAGDRRDELLAAVGLDGKCATSVLAVGAAPGAEPPNDADLRSVDVLVELSARVRHPDALCVRIDDTFYVVAASRTERLPDLTDLGRQIVERAAGRTRDLHVGIGTTIRSADVHLARRDADRVLQALAERGPAGAIATFEEVRLLSVLAELRRLARAHPELLDGPVRAMLDPERRAPEWSIETLRAYFDNFGSLPAAAAALGIHANSLRYRLRRLAELFDLRLEDPDHRLIVAMQLRLLAPADRRQPPARDR